jgi:hypothetical protein
MKFSDYYGRTIQAAALVYDELRITFTDGDRIGIYDAGQDCCEDRYMTCDDDLEGLAGKTLVAIGDDRTGDGEGGEVHDLMFLDIKTQEGVAATVMMHNEHNGYYGGFSVRCRAVRLKTGV